MQTIPYIFVFAPYITTEDENLNYYYDFSQSIQEYTKVFAELGWQWKWVPTTMDNYKTNIAEVLAHSANKLQTNIVLNLCDGDETNHTPGISVIKELEKNGVLYTGADAYFYEITTSKIKMKEAFDKAGVATPKWKVIHSETNNASDVVESLTSPIIIKPSVSGGSMGVGIKNVVHTSEQCHALIKHLKEGYRGWNLMADGLLAEEFIAGNEYTVFIIGNYTQFDEAYIYPPVERVFHKSLPLYEQFLSFDRLWETYTDETPMPNNEYFYEYHSPPNHLHTAIMQLAWDAYVAVKGVGYGRIDIRKNNATESLYVLEVNAQCGISEDEDFTSIGAILRLSGKTFTEIVKAIIFNGINR